MITPGAIEPGAQSLERSHGHSQEAGPNDRLNLLTLSGPYTGPTSERLSGPIALGDGLKSPIGLLGGPVHWHRNPLDELDARVVGKAVATVQGTMTQAEREQLHQDATKYSNDCERYQKEFRHRLMGTGGIGLEPPEKPESVRRYEAAVEKEVSRTVGRLEGVLTADKYAENRVFYNDRDAGISNDSVTRTVPATPGDVRKDMMSNMASSQSKDTPQPICRIMPDGSIVFQPRPKPVDWDRK